MAKKTIKETSQQIGKAIARSTHKIESAGKKAQSRVEEAVDNVSQKAKDLMKNMGKVEEDTSSPTCPFRINAGNSLEGQIGETAGAIYEYLTQKGTVPISRLVRAVMQKKHTQTNVYAAIGWLMREAKLEFTEDGAEVSLRK
jgi:hypothetical protein